MRVAVLSDISTWMNSYIPRIIEILNTAGHDVDWSHHPDDIKPSEVCFLLSWERIVPTSFRERFQHCLVVHASDLPRGRGWSPMTWQILSGARRIPLTLIEAEDEVDSGDIYLQNSIETEGHELIDELHDLVGEQITVMCIEFVQRYPEITREARPQIGEPTYFARRIPADSKIDIKESIESQMNLLRVVNNEKYPAFFDFMGHKYLLRVEKAPKD